MIFNIINELKLILHFSVAGATIFIGHYKNSMNKYPAVQTCYWVLHWFCKLSVGMPSGLAGK